MIEEMKKRDIYDVYEKHEQHGKPTFPELMPINEEGREVFIQQLNRRDRASIPRGLYVHIPFCDSICNFCMFDRVLYSKEKEEVYVAALKQSLLCLADTPFGKNGRLCAIYMGGGTPSSLQTSNLADLISSINKNFKRSDDVEFTVEGNHHSFSKDKVKAILDSGGNRISLGVQTFHNKQREILNLPGTTTLVENRIQEIGNAGCRNLDIDILYGIPEQTMETWMEDINSAIRLGVTSASIYNMILHPGTPLGRKVLSEKTIQLPSKQERIDAFLSARDAFVTNGYIQQHLYHFVKPGFENNYLKVRFQGNSDCLSCGNTSAGRIGDFLFRSIVDYRQWIDAIKRGDYGIGEAIALNPEQRLRDYIIKAFELIRIDREFSKKYYGCDVVKKFDEIWKLLVKKGLVRITDNTIELTHLGITWGWNVIKEFHP
jgi:coproporphyrinogen III oxidase-like Fe-S oxidoreductase